MERTKVRGCSQGFCPSEFTKNPEPLVDASVRLASRELARGDTRRRAQGVGVGVIFQMSATHWPLPWASFAKALPVPQ
jgi:hypothetical protein